MYNFFKSILVIMTLIGVTSCGQMGTMYHPTVENINEDLACTGKWTKDPIPNSIRFYGTVMEDMFTLVNCKELTPKGEMSNDFYIDLNLEDKRVVGVKLESGKLLFKDEVVIRYPNGSIYRGQVSDNFIPHGKGNWSHGRWVSKSSISKLKSDGIEFVPFTTQKNVLSGHGRNQHLCTNVQITGNFIQGKIEGKDIRTLSFWEPPKVSDVNVSPIFVKESCYKNHSSLHKSKIGFRSPADRSGKIYNGDKISNFELYHYDDKSFNVMVKSEIPCKGTIKNAFPKLMSKYGKYGDETYNACRNHEFKYDNINPVLSVIK